ncbi:MAG: DUF1622 domain-containing protein [Chloroflexota bacterium]|nr:DUF1622 domain-containing protein [Chloroflexota bacterium]
MEFHEIVKDIIELAAFALEAISVFYIVAAVIVGTIRFLYLGFVKREKINLVNQYRAHVASGLLLGLEILIAADIVRTVALEMTITNLLALGFLVLIRTFLSWSLVVEIEGRWPWQPKKE